MGIHYDYKSTKSAKLMEKQAKREKKLAEKKAKRSLVSRLRNYFLTGAVVLVPIAVTFNLTLFIIKISPDTDAPASASAVAHPMPIPEEEPTIKALLLSKRKEGIFGNFIDKLPLYWLY